MRPTNEKAGPPLEVTLVRLALLLAFLTCTASLSGQAPGTFIPIGNMTTPRHGHTATLLLNGKVLITGGQDSTSGTLRLELASAELFDPDTETFTRIGDMTMPRRFHSATLLPDGRVLIAGGDGYVRRTPRTAEIYDPSTETF